MMNLVGLGWSPFFADAFSALAIPETVPARVCADHGALTRIFHADGEALAEPAGKLREKPAVGDWVAVRLISDRARIEAILPRRTRFSRAAVGGPTVEQVVAANVDVCFVVAGLDHDLNARRLERYLLACRQGGAAPVVVLNKADFTPDADIRAETISALAGDVPVLPVSALRGDGLQALDAWLTPGTTVALLGSSGAGKTTLANALSGQARRTRAVREDDSRGRHTTTHRELIVLPTGALLVDTPGMRELSLWEGAETGFASTFEDLTAVAAACRFSDCTHEHEPGCAVREAIEDGRLEEGRLAGYQKLRRELQHMERRHSHRLLIEEKQRWKAITRAYRARMK